MSELFDPIRKLWVTSTPEERVRQAWLKKMTEIWGYPKHLLAVEVELKSFPHLQRREVPHRRIDIVCFSPKGGLPLLLMECKAEAVTAQALEQVRGYNIYVQAPYVAVVSAAQFLIDPYLAAFPAYEEIYA